MSSKYCIVVVLPPFPNISLFRDSNKWLHMKQNEWIYTLKYVYIHPYVVIYLKCLKRLIFRNGGSICQIIWNFGDRLMERIRKKGTQLVIKIWKQCWRNFIQLWMQPFLAHLESREAQDTRVAGQASLIQSFQSLLFTWRLNSFFFLSWVQNALLWCCMKEQYNLPSFFLWKQRWI